MYVTKQVYYFFFFFFSSLNYKLYLHIKLVITNFEIPVSEFRIIRVELDVNNFFGFSI